MYQHRSHLPRAACVSAFAYASGAMVSGMLAVYDAMPSGEPTAPTTPLSALRSTGRIQHRIRSCTGSSCCFIIFRYVAVFHAPSGKAPPALYATPSAMICC